MQKARSLIEAAREKAAGKFSVRRVAIVAEHPVLKEKTILLIVELKRNRPRGQRRDMRETSPDAVVFAEHHIDPRTLPNWAVEVLKKRKINDDVSRWLSRLDLSVKPKPKPRQ
jgi:hypothetical protein